MSTTNLNMITLLKEGLEREIKGVVVDSIVKEQVEQFERTIRERIKPIVNSLSFDSIEHIKDFSRMRDELHVYLHYGDETEEKKI